MAAFEMIGCIWNNPPTNPDKSNLNIRTKSGARRWVSSNVVIWLEIKDQFGAGRQVVSNAAN